MDETLRQFIRTCNPRGTAQTALFIGYHLEVIEARGGFTAREIRGGFIAARVTPPANPSDVLGRLQKRRLVVLLEAGPPRRCALSQQGLEIASARLNEIGWFASVAPERTEIVREISEKLHQDVMSVADEAERDFIQEALACLHPAVNAYRAAVIMGWSAAVYNLRNKVMAKGLAAFNTEFQRRFPRSKKVADDLNDLQEFKDRELLDVCQGIGILSPSVKKQLEPLLSLRNGCAHPTGVKPEIHRVKAFFEDIIRYVLSPRLQA